MLIFRGTLLSFDSYFNTYRGFRMKKIFLILLLICNLLDCNYLQAKEPFIRKISYREGLSTEVIYDLFTDTKGYIYLGTDKGLMRYNGHEFKKFAIVGNLANSINNISEDADGNIWCKNFSNQIFCLKNDTLNLIPELQRIIQKSNLREFSLNDYFLWIALHDKILKYDIRTNQVEIIKNIDLSIDQNQYFDIKYDNGTVFFSDLATIYEYKFAKVTDLKSFNGQKNICTHNQELFSVIKGRDKILANISKKSKLSLDGIPENIYFHYFVSTGEKLWLCTTNGLYDYSNAKSAASYKILDGQRISDVIRDHEGNYWISTLDDGLYFMPHPDIRYISSVNVSNSDKIKFNRIISGPENSFFIGSNQGTVFHCDSNGSLIKSYVSHMNSEVDFLYFDSINYKLYFSYGLIDLKKQNFENHEIYGKDLYPDDKGNFLVCTYSFAGLITKKTGEKPLLNTEKKYDYTLFGKNYHVLLLNNVRTRVGFFSIKYQKYYIGSSDGLIIVDKSLKRKEIQLPRGEKIIAIDIMEDQNGDIWVSSLQSGIIKIRNNEILERYSVDNGLVSNNCGKMTIYGENIWLLTDEGINTINIKTTKVRDISATLALKGISFNDIMAKEEQICLTAGAGIIIIPAAITTDYAKPIIRFNAFYVKGIMQDFNIPIPYSKNEVLIDFDAIHYKSWGRYQFRYRLLGVDTSWQTKNIQKKNINYLSLPSGRYSFQVQAYAAGVYSDVLELPFVVSKPFWQSIWFVLLAFASSIFFVYLFSKMAINRIRKKQQLKEQLALSQLTALRAQMNPHFMFNILNAVQGLIYAGKKYDATNFLGKFSELMRKTLEMSDKQEILLSKEIEALKLYVELEAGRFDNDFHYSINVDNILISEDIKIPSMIIQPFVENAIKHGLMHKIGKKILDVSLNKTTENIIEIIVDDNGIGRKASAEMNKTRKKHLSFATAAISSRVNLLNKTLKKPIFINVIDKISEEGICSGTTVIIKIPLNK
jgi:ligand-binding sensor domain-containing protein